MTDADRTRALFLRWAPRHCICEPPQEVPDSDFRRYLSLMAAYLEAKAEYASR